jgi:hypothetical protein
MLGNAGGAKGPDFWRAFEDGEVKVIGDEPDGEMLRLHCSVMWPVHGTGLISARCAGFLFQGGRTEK